MADHAEARRPVNIDKDLLAILCCPDTKQDVSLADDALIAKLNEAVTRGQLKNMASKPVTEPLDGGLTPSSYSIFETDFVLARHKGLEDRPHEA